MPVMVTGAETSLGRATVRALRRTGGEIRGYLDAEAAGEAEAEALRRLGVKAAVGTLDDEGHLELALEQVHTVVHCWGGPLTAPAEELDALAGVLSAALGAGCRRFVWGSHQGADAPQGVAYLEACAQAEALLADATLESIVVRRSLTYGAGDELTRRLAAGGAAAVRPTARHAPLALDDLARALAQADRMERSAARSELSLVVELAGPVTLPFGEVVAALRAAGLGGGPPDPLPGTAVALYDRDLEPGPAALGREGTTLEQATGALRAG